MLTEKDYCDYETCVTLKELGYKVPTSAYYMPKNSQLIFVINQFRGGAAMDCFYSNNSLPKECMASDYIDAPTMWEAQKWLREEKNIIVDVRYGALYYNVVLNHTITGGRHIVKDKNNRIADFTEYEEALSEGIKEAVKILKENETL